MICKKCHREIEDAFEFCPYCGQNQNEKRRVNRRRANGEGTAYKRGKKWTSLIRVKTVMPDGTVARVPYTKGGFATRREALLYLPELAKSIKQPHDANVYADISFAQLYEKLMERHALRVGKSTLYCYRAAYKYFSDIHHMKFADLNTEDWQLCIDDCPHGTRTRENMKALGTLMYGYAQELRVIDRNFAAFVWIDRTGSESRLPFTLDEVAEIKAAAARGVPYAAWVLSLCYSGFRPGEFLTLPRGAFDPVAKTLRGGAKTDAGKNRIVPVHPVIMPYISERYLSGTPLLFQREDGAMPTAYFREKCFYPLLDQLGIQPIPSPNEKPGRTPYSCRHTFATLIKSVDGALKDKAALMGHTSYEMTLHYQHEDLISLRNIINNIA